jgi:hypothetical protein
VATPPPESDAEGRYPTYLKLFLSKKPMKRPCASLKDERTYCLPPVSSMEDRMGVYKDEYATPVRNVEGTRPP